MILDNVLQLPAAQAMLRYQQENPWDRSARLIFTDYLRDHDLFEVADCLGKSLEMSGAVALPDGSFVYDGWARTPEFEIFKGVKMKFCWIPAGKAMLGSPASQEGHCQDEVSFPYEARGFWLGKYPVTQAQWVGVMGSNPSHFKGEKLPVEQVNWNDCQDFVRSCAMNSLSIAVNGLSVDLPDEHDWEYACCGGLGNQQPFYWGKTLDGSQANCDGTRPYGTNYQGYYLRRTTEVGAYEKAAPHPWGLCDIIGNVLEWCSGFFVEGEMYRVVKGGSWYTFPVGCRAAYCTYSTLTNRFNHNGFRVCLYHAPPADADAGAV